jgi:hypothetical protein
MTLEKQIDIMLNNDVLINKLFYPPTRFRKIRKCKYLNNFRINKKSILQKYKSYWFEGSEWEKCTYKEFNEDLKDYFNEKLQEIKENKIEKLDWSFINL